MLWSYAIPDAALHVYIHCLLLCEIQIHVWSWGITLWWVFCHLNS